ncbi:uncharacterized protein LOC127258024 [Andrographis paniculata]|uniref:uncharacterized protein LOC127258024 n=1 Tax=Andrographis paniculata TaxID=175694 RepID=UPI0021E81299|nr:uncharacterized protein LOC127258024 [Andrographis paniculata]
MRRIRTTGTLIVPEQQHRLPFVVGGNRIPFNELQAVGDGFGAEGIGVSHGSDSVELVVGGGASGGVLCVAGINISDNIDDGSLSSRGVQLIQLDDHHVSMNNGIVSITLTVPNGDISEVTYKGGNNLLDANIKEEDRGRWNMVWNGLDPGKERKIFDGYVMLRESSGFYSYAIFEHPKERPAFGVQVGRLVFKLSGDKFNYMARSDTIQRYMPNGKDRSTGQPLDVKEAVLLTNPTNPLFKGEVDDKYFYACHNKDSQVHGWVSNENRPVGIWMITPSNEFRAGGPLKQDLTSHVEATLLSVFNSRHYVGDDIDLKFDKNEYWKKVIGPLYIHLNSEASAKTNPSVLWNEAKQTGYQFWTETDASGKFTIKNVVAGTYTLFAWVNGTLGDYASPSQIIVTSGSSSDVGNVVFEPPRKGATLWEIGVPDRTAREFFIPNPRPEYKIHKYGTHIEKIKQYGLWKRYQDIYPNDDLVFTIGSSDYKKDWFYAHVTRQVQGSEYKPTTWRIQFKLEQVKANYTLQLALASANHADIEVRFNDPKSVPHFTAVTKGKDNAVARYGDHGIYHIYSIDVGGRLLLRGQNTVYLTITTNREYTEVTYDYIRLEGSP